jgi:hypothetical protein
MIGRDTRMTAPDDPSSLDEEPFAYRAGKDGTVLVAWRGKTVTTLRGKEAQRFLARVAGLEGREAQLAMAKITGNFKRGNERLAKRENEHRE